MRAVRRGLSGIAAGAPPYGGRGRVGAGAGGAQRHRPRGPPAGRLSQPLHGCNGSGDRRELAQLGVGWFEEPVQPRTAAAELASIARQVPLPVAGGESGYGCAFFDRLPRQRRVSIIMPDIKHCGGVGEAVRAGRSALHRGGAFSLHSPSGPISLLASAHATAAVPGALPLEHAVGEVDWRAGLITPAERIEGGAGSCRRPRASAQPSTGAQSAAAATYGPPEHVPYRCCLLTSDLREVHQSGAGAGRLLV